jgi:uncharacterized protein YbjT (DUF2867 family)
MTTTGGVPDTGRVLVAGASGGTGRQLLRLLRHTDYTVRALTRDAAKESDLREAGADEVVVGDLVESADAERAVAEADAVLCAVGSSPGLDLLSREPVDGHGVVNLVDATVAVDCAAFVLESSIGVGSSEPGMPSVFRLFLNAFGIVAAKERAEEHLRSSGVPYTIVRPGGLTDDPPTGEVVVGEGGDTVSGQIPRADVARLMVAALSSPDARNRTFEVVSRAGLRGKATGVVDPEWRLPEPVPETDD